MEGVHCSPEDEVCKVNDQEDSHDNEKIPHLERLEEEEKDTEREGAEECFNLPPSVVLGLCRLCTPARSWQRGLQRTG